MCPSRELASVWGREEEGRRGGGERVNGERMRLLLAIHCAGLPTKKGPRLDDFFLMAVVLRLTVAES